MRLNLKINWLEKLNQDSDLKIKNWREIYHLIILPMYKEDYEVVRESFSRLKAVNYPKEKMIIVLGIEERAGEIAEETARKIEKEFSRFFFKFLITEHPANLPGEIAGKGSNETWAIKEAKKNIIDFLKIPYENILVSSFDVDTQPGSDYFGILTYKFLIAEKPQHSSYQPIPLFTNNVYQAPAFARVVSFCTTSWAMMRQAWQERLRTFSSHSVPFKPLIEVGFWQTDIVSEDSRIFWQLFLHFDGDWRTEPLFYPVGMDANMAPTFWQTLKNLYRQQRRWAWGPCENIPYFLSGWRGRKISWRQKVYHALVLIEDAHAWATNALIIFIFGRLPVYAGGEAFRVTLLSVNLPRVTGFIISLTSV